MMLKIAKFFEAASLKVRFGLFLTLLLTLFFKLRPPVRVLWFPESVPQALLQTAQGWGQIGPWFVPGRQWMEPIQWQHRTLHALWPIALGHEKCLREDYLWFDGACPLAVKVAMDFPADADWEVLIPLIEWLRQKPEASRLMMSSLGTVRVYYQGYEFVLGRKERLKRLQDAWAVLQQPSWSSERGRLDLRYSDGFSFQEII